MNAPVPGNAPAPQPQYQQPAPQATPQNASAAPQGGGWLRTGGGIREMQNRHAAEQQQRADLRKAGIGGKGPLRFRLQKGESRNIVVLDVSIDSGLGIREHNLKDAQGKWGNIEPCIMDSGNCPICSKYGQEGYYVVLLTILDLTGYEKKDQNGNPTGEFVPHSRMLLPIKLSQMDKWRQLEAAALGERGTMRGMYLTLQRGMDDKSIGIGEPQILQGGRLFFQYTEEELVQYFGHAAVLGRDNRTVIKEANADITPFPYLAIFKEPDPADLYRRFGTASLGNPHQAATEFNQPNAPRPAPSRSAPPPGGVAQQPQQAYQPAPPQQQAYQPAPAQPPQPAYQQPAYQPPAPAAHQPPAPQPTQYAQPQAQPAYQPAPAPAPQPQPTQVQYAQPPAQPVYQQPAPAAQPAPQPTPAQVRVRQAMPPGVNAAPAPQPQPQPQPEPQPAPVHAEAPAQGGDDLPFA